MEKFKQTLLWSFVAFACVISNSALAQKELGLFNSVAVGVSASTAGIGVDVATPVTPHFALRGGVSFMPKIKINTDVDVEIEEAAEAGINPNTTLDLEGSIGRASGELLVNYYPFNKGTFFVTAGAYFGGSKLVKIKGHSDELAEYISQAGSAGIVIGDYTIPVDKNGDVSGGLKVAGFRPYVGLGFGRAVPKNRIGFSFELGVQFHGTPKVYTDYGSLGDAWEDADDSFTKIIDHLTVYPVMKFRLCGRLL
ncbi:hypothetical protein [Parabacteroides bouchesdurhonensis]|uniref:hypothetical protein n=1 Tax=Parabacteroides bouchesdurhonensis TaxID=1936995 RepID=UPI000C85F6DD|nr:hypothetical protein [Parabacteroides bouchesdurhonensis]